MTDPHPKEEAVFAAASNLPEAQRAPYLAKACGDDAQMRQRVETRLGSPRNGHNLMEDSATNPAVDLDETITSDGVLAREELIGETFGRYTLVEKLGEGGFGSVYVAEQKEPVQRRVAFKITKLGMDTKEVVGRFKKERQALAMMDHPGIAKVLDAGATDAGRPYFVMELVKGVRITEFCDQNKLSTYKRLELFIKVCRAIEHAHQKGIIHRDIKPSNVLVAMHDGKPVPKVIDFGIAKATQESAMDKVDFTAAGQFVGTPAYMSPEQADSGGMDVDTRTDIYSLGVLLYELLTAQTPLESKNLLARGFDEMRRMIREFEPQLPSLRLGNQEATDSTSTAKRHGTDAPKLIKMVKGDLDWVVMKCLEKDRSRRYETAGGLAADVGRVLHDEPVEARPPSKLYHFQKLVRRNKAVFVLGISVWLALVIGLGMTTWLVLKEKEQRDLAELATSHAKLDLKKAEFAQKEAETSREQSEAALKQAETSRQKAEAALQQSEVDRAKAQAAQKQAVDSQKEAETARQQAETAQKQAETALQQARAEHDKADTAERKAKDSLTVGQEALRQAEAAEKRVMLAETKSEQAIQTAADEAELRRKAEAASAAALTQASQSRGAMTNLLAGLLHLEPVDGNLVSWLAPLLAEVGETNGYGHLCGTFLKQGGVTNNPALAMDCLLAPTPEVDASSLAALAKNMAVNQQGGWQLVLGLAEYRQGHFAEAADSAGKALAGGESVGEAEAEAVLAMADAHLNQPGSAREALNKGQQILDTKMPKPESGDLGRSWPEWVAARVLLREAKKE